jgi:DNA-binding transcriptional MerR regulator
MTNKRVLVIDAYNVIKVFRDLGVSFEEIAALGCHLDGEPSRSVTPEVVAVWFEEEKQERVASTIVSVKKSEPQ